jgi:tetratricopeptide (TPR) repeat protein
VNATNPLCKVGEGKILWMNGKEAEAKKAFYDASILIVKKDIDMETLVRMEIAEAYINADKKDLDEALRLLNRCLEINAKNAELYLLLGDLYLEKDNGNASNAIANYEKAALLDKTSVKAILRQGQIYNNAKNYNLALDYYIKASLIDSSYAPAYREKAEIYFRAGQYDNATAQFKRYLELNNNCSARGRYAGFLNKAEKYKESVIAANEALQCDPTKIYTYRYKGRSEYEIGDYVNGLKSMNTLFELAAKNENFKIIADDYVYRAKLLSKNNQDSLAMLEFNKALAMDSTDIVLNREVGKLFMQLKNYAGAIKIYKNNIATGKHNANDYFGLGRAYYYANDYANADSAFKQITVTNPSLPLGYLWRARAQTQQDPNNAKWLAKPFYEKLITIVEAGDVSKNTKDLIEAYTYMGVYYMKNKDMCTAKGYFKKTVNLDATNTNANTFLQSPEAKKCP